MLNFIKYEIKGTYKYIFGAIAIVLVLIASLFGTAFFTSKTGGESTTLGLFLTLSIFILFGTVISTFLYIVGSFRKELYEDRGYLTFTLPLNGRQIVASKLIVAILWYIVIAVIIGGFITGLFLLLGAKSEYGITEFFSIIKILFTDIIGIKGTIYGLLASIFSLIFMLILIYFSMAISKMTFKNKKVGGLWFIIYILLAILIGMVQYKLMTVFPYYLNFKNLEFETINNISDALLNNEFLINYDNGSKITGDFNFVRMNIVSAIYNILITLGLFVGTGYLIDKKIEL